jgi:hypothetical protein
MSSKWEILIKETFEAHQPIIGSWARENSDNFSDVYRFVLATIQQPIDQTPAIVRDFKDQGGDSAYAFGLKRVALDWLDDNAGLLYDNAMYIAHIESNLAGRFATPALLSYFASLPGLGLVKGGFLAQLCFGEVGCIDTHNVDRFGLNPSRFAASRFKNAKTTKTRKAIINEYLGLCDKCGGCALLWAEWCEYVADKYPQRYESPQAVSKLHLDALGLEESAA